MFSLFALSSSSPTPPNISFMFVSTSRFTRSSSSSSSSSSILAIDSSGELIDFLSLESFSAFDSFSFGPSLRFTSSSSSSLSLWAELLAEISLSFESSSFSESERLAFNGAPGVFGNPNFKPINQLIDQPEKNIKR
ncbi:hypothetical protein DERP_000993 [Dermatophagoides pteronyssinus]|uniref:Uncharacterized protein n=1 Tax=Dermatophagoides pteronyssinus TaxID=6956 RepID=A0ABQ8JDR2_DERPT|nr:hypothetical protein DERP_000993 [Dermatophagoides pteronyssinus]